MPKVTVSYGHGANTYEVNRSKFVIVNGQVYEEHTHNAEVGVRVKNHLLRHGVQVQEVQPPNGADVPLKTRTDAANAWGADLYWSIHANAATASARGWAAFYWKGSADGERAARLYAKHVQALGLPLYSGDGIYPSESGTWSDFHELRETRMIAILTENGFMTNAEDFKYIFLNLNGHWDKLAEAHAKAILEYFGIAWKPVYVPPATTAPTTTGTYRVIVDGVQVGAYGNADNIINQVEIALAAGKNKIELQKV